MCQESNSQQINVPKFKLMWCSGKMCTKFKKIKIRSMEKCAQNSKIDQWKNVHKIKTCSGKMCTKFKLIVILVPISMLHSSMCNQLFHFALGGGSGCKFLSSVVYRERLFGGGGGEREKSLDLPQLLI